HCITTGIEGGLHSKDYRIIDETEAYITPVKLLCMTVIDLLYDGAKEATRVKEAFQPQMTKAEYLRLLEELDQQLTY
ncbi:MAG: amidohydrolase, partial [Angelakisella sp.]